MVAAAVWPLSQVSDSGGGTGRGWQGLAGAGRGGADVGRGGQTGENVLLAQALQLYS